MPRFIKLGTRHVNPAHIVSISQVRAPDPSGKGRQIRVDVIGFPAEYFNDDEALKTIDELLQDRQQQRSAQEY